MMVSSGRPWVRFTDSAERDRVRPAVLLNRKFETCQVEDCVIPRARARISSRGVVPVPTTGVRDLMSSRIAPSDGERAAKLRLEAPRKSSAKTMTRKPDASKRSRSYVDTLTSSPPAEDAAWTEAPGCRRLQLTSESAGKEYNLAPATEWFPPNTSITESAPIPPKAKPVEAFPSASIKKSTPSYPVASPSVPPFIEAKRYNESWSRRLAYRAMETFASKATVAASNIGTDDQSPNEPSIVIGADGPDGGTKRIAAIVIATRRAAAIDKNRTRREG